MLSHAIPHADDALALHSTTGAVKYVSTDAAMCSWVQHSQGHIWLMAFQTLVSRIASYSSLSMTVHMQSRPS
jgi:hypothetical protein